MWSGKLKGSGKNVGMVAKIAIKNLKPKEGVFDGEVALLKEARAMVALRHKNLVCLYGLVTKGEPMLLVAELAENGCLLTFLRGDWRRKPKVPKLINWCTDIASGMAHLEEEGYIHRDLAARNILLDIKFNAKVADFGMSRFVDDGVYDAGETPLCPIRWTSPEGISYGMFCLFFVFLIPRSSDVLLCCIVICLSGESQ